MEYNAGSFVHFMELQQPVFDTDSGGGKIRRWRTIDEIWVCLRTPTSREAYVAGQKTLELSHMVDSRYIEGITPTMRFRYDNRIFAIQSVKDEDNRKRFISIFCIERDDVDAEDNDPVTPVYSLNVIGSVGIASEEVFGSGGTIA